MGALIAMAALVLLVAFLVTVLVARFAYAGPCPRCSRQIPHGALDCPHCGFCTPACVEPQPRPRRRS
jgi:hypothetical protein